MALSQKHRSSIYTHLTPIIGEEEAEALLSHFPARDLDEPVTKEFVRAEIAQLRGEMNSGLSGLEARISERFRQQTIWIVSALAVGIGIASGIGQLFG